MLTFIGLDLVQGASLTIAQNDYSAQWTLVDADAVIERHADEVLRVGADLMARIDAGNAELAA